MDSQSNVSDENKYFNVIQIIMLNAAATSLLLLGALASGASLFTAVVPAWLGGAVLTLFGVSSVYMLRSRAEKTVSRDTAPDTAKVRTLSKRGPDLVPDFVTDPMHLWEADRLAEIDFALGKLSETPQQRRPRRKPPAAMVAVWEADAAEDAEAIGVAPKRPVRADRRQSNAPYAGPNRRAAGQ